MTKTPAAILLAALFTTVTLAQTSTTTTARRPVHRATTASSRAKSVPSSAPAAANPADNPPNVPKVAGTPKPLYALRYIDTVIGTGALAEPQKFYTVRYTGWLTDGTKFDSSDDHPGKEPITFPYGAHRVIPGWDTGFEGMHVGGKRRIFIPYQLAYGEAGRPPVIPAKADLIFDMELVSMSDAPPTPPVPAPAPAAAPSDTGKPPTQPVDPTKPTSTTPAPSSNPTAAPNTPSSPK